MALKGKLTKTRSLTGTITRSGGGGSVQEIYLVQYGVGTATNAEVNEAVAANKLPVCYCDSTNAYGQTTRDLYYMIHHTPTEAFFANVSPTTGAIWVRRLFADAWNTQMIRYQEALTWDQVPRFGSQNPVTSGGIYQALQNVSVAVDSELSTTSENPVQNKVITEALATKADQASVESTIPPIVNTWLGNNVAQETGYVLDSSLTMSNAAAPADKVGDLRSAFTVLKLPLIQGGYINAEGNFPSSDNFSISDFCPFSVGDNFELFDFNNASWSSYCLGYAFYDSSKTYISGSGSGNFDGHLSSASVTIPQNTAYVRFSTRTQFSPNAYIIISYINGAVNKIDRKFAGKQDVIPTIITVGNQTGCDYSTIQSAIDAITDDSQLKPYIIRVLPGTYDLFTLRGVTSVNPRYISIIGTDAINTIIQDNRGNYDYPAAAIQTNGTIENLTFINRTDAEHHTQTQGRTFAYAMHIDFGSVKLKVINCLFICNAGPAVGVGTWQDCELEFNDCKFISECDGTFGAKTNGAFFAHTGLLNDITNQNLTIKNSVAISQYDSTGARFVIISGYTGGRYNYNFQNFGAFGNNGASAVIVDPNSELIGDYSFNNVPNTLNTPNS